MVFPAGIAPALFRLEDGCLFSSATGANENGRAPRCCPGQLPLRRLRTTVMLEAAAPLVVTAVVSAIIGVLASLYPASTVLLAAVLLRERIHRAQGVGLLLCALAITCVAAG